MLCFFGRLGVPWDIVPGLLTEVCRNLQGRMHQNQQITAHSSTFINRGIIIIIIIIHLLQIFSKVSHSEIQF